MLVSMSKDSKEKMKTARWIIAVVLALASVPFALIAAYIAFISPNEQIRSLGTDQIALIGVAQAYISDFRIHNQRNPTPAEFNQWKESQTENFPDLDGRGYALLDAPIPITLQLQFGAPPEGAFVLTFWYSKAWVDYVSWAGNGKLAYIPDAEYFAPFGGKLGSVFLFATISGIFLAFAAKARPKGK